MDRACNNYLLRVPRGLAYGLSRSLVESLVAGEALLDRSDHLLVVVHGATATGKTSLAVHLAERFSGEIVSCDSVAVYRELEIGTAKPSPEERARIPHHMLDVVSPDQPYTAGDYARDARASLGEIVARVNLPIVAGGTGLYLRALIDGLFPGPRRFENLRVRLREIEKKRGSGRLARILRRLDPVSAARIHENDTPKLVRAIEVTLAARKPMSRQWEVGRDALRGFRVLRLGLDPQRPALYARINQRAAGMFSRGLVEETGRLLAKYGEDCRPLSSLGYKQAAMLLRGEISLEDGIAATQQGHRNYAKRQKTWFRREPDVHWLNGFGDDSAIVEEAASLIMKTNAQADSKMGAPGSRS
ncbi:MAG: tRNA (adenosine(37)-N6)-dimethylallyltransferase MiaA [Acidobacteriaceae bacterium]